MKNISFIINQKDGTISLLVDGEVITDCFSLYNEELLELISQLGEFANVPILADVTHIFSNEIARESFLSHK